MTTSITPFLFGECLIRTVEHNGSPWFIAADVCAALSLDNVTRALASLDPEELTLLKVRSGGQEREMNAVSEPGLYRLVFKSRKPEARAFQHWVYHEVLPTIRRTGSYTPNNLAYMALLRDQIALGVPAALAARIASKMIPATLPQLPIQDPAQAADTSLADLIGKMEDGRYYTSEELMAFLPPRHDVFARNKTVQSRRIAFGCFLKPARTDGRIRRKEGAGRNLYFKEATVVPFSSESN